MILLQSPRRTQGFETGFIVDSQDAARLSISLLRCIESMLRAEYGSEVRLIVAAGLQIATA